MARKLSKSTAADMDHWVSEHVGLPANTSIIGTCAGRAYRGSDLLPCLIVTAALRMARTGAQTHRPAPRIASGGVDGIDRQRMILHRVLNSNGRHK